MLREFLGLTPWFALAGFLGVDSLSSNREGKAMKNHRDQYFFVDLLGYIIFAALVCAVIAVGAAAFWFVFCHPGSKMVELIPFLRPARVTVTCILGFLCYQFLANPARGEHPTSRLLELIAILLVSAGLGAVRFLYGTGDGSTVTDLQIDTAVRWSMCLGLTIPMCAFALLGYRAGGRKSQTPDATDSATKSISARNVSARFSQIALGLASIVARNRYHGLPTHLRLDETK